MRNQIFVGLAAIALLAMLIIGVFVSVTPGAFAAVPTPQTFNPAIREAEVFEWFVGKKLTADARECLELRNFNAADVQWVIDQGDSINTTTLKLQFSNDNAHFKDGATLASANTADADDFNRQLVYGRYACVNADLASTDEVTVTAIGTGK